MKAIKIKVPGDFLAELSSSTELSCPAARSNFLKEEFKFLILTGNFPFEPFDWLTQESFFVSGDKKYVLKVSVGKFETIFWLTAFTKRSSGLKIEVGKI